MRKNLQSEIGNQPYTQQGLRMAQKLEGQLAYPFALRGVSEKPDSAMQHQEDEMGDFALDGAAMLGNQISSAQGGGGRTPPPRQLDFSKPKNPFPKNTMKNASFDSYAFNAAWAVLKANPQSQAWDRSYGSQLDSLAHPDLPLAIPESLEIRNRGTIDPRAIAMRNRAWRSLPYHERSIGTEVAGRDSATETGFGTTHGDRKDYSNMDDTAGFTALSPVGGISRVDRPHAEAQVPERHSPQDIIESMFAGKYGPMTPEEEAELINRLRMAQQ